MKTIPWRKVKMRMNTNDTETTTGFDSRPLLTCIGVLRQQANVTIEAEDWKAAASLLEKAGDLCWLMAERAGNAAA